MDRSEFWKLIEGAKAKSNGDVDEQLKVLTEKLAELPPNKIIGFDNTLDELMGESYTQDLWAAAYIINGGCSDDCFDYFRGWLIAQGEAVFNNALKDPETLTNVAEPDNAELEGILTVAWTAYENKTGSKFPMHTKAQKQLTGDKWDEDTLDTKYPKLWAKFGQ